MRRTLNIPTADGIRAVDGQVMFLQLTNDEEVKTFVHEWRGEQVLAHYASGYRIGALGPIKLARFIADGFTKLSDRAAAQAIVDRIPVDTWHKAIANKPILNK